MHTPSGNKTDGWAKEDRPVNWFARHLMLVCACLLIAGLLALYY